MKREVITYNEIIGFHRYPNAPEFCKYLENKHRHVFVIRCRFSVAHNEREIEINEQQNNIAKLFHRMYGTPCEFGGRSCETIAEEIMKMYPACTSVEILEDNYGGAALTR